MFLNGILLSSVIVCCQGGKGITDLKSSLQVYNDSKVCNATAFLHFLCQLGPADWFVVTHREFSPILLLTTKMTSFRHFQQRVILLGALLWLSCAHLTQAFIQSLHCCLIYDFYILNVCRSIISDGEILQHKTSNGHVDSNSHLGTATSDVEVLDFIFSY